MKMQKLLYKTNISPDILTVIELLMLINKIFLLKNSIIFLL